MKELYNHTINATKNSFFANVMGVNNSKIFINYVIKHSFKMFLDQALHTYITDVRHKVLRKSDEINNLKTCCSYA